MTFLSDVFFLTRFLLSKMVIHAIWRKMVRRSNNLVDRMDRCFSFVNHAFYEQRASASVTRRRYRVHRAVVSLIRRWHVRNRFIRVYGTARSLLEKKLKKGVTARGHHGELQFSAYVIFAICAFWAKLAHSKTPSRGTDPKTSPIMLFARLLPHRVDAHFSR